MIEASPLSVAVVVGTVGVCVEADQKCSVQSFANLLAASVQLVLSPYGIFDRNIDKSICRRALHDNEHVK